MSEEQKKTKSGCTINTISYNPVTETVDFTTTLNSNLKCDAWEIGPYSTRVDGLKVPLKSLVKAVVVQWIGVRLINAKLKKGPKADAEASLRVGYDWDDFFTKESKKLSPVEQARTSASKITDLDELQKLIADMQKQALLLSGSNEDEDEVDPTDDEESLA